MYRSIATFLRLFHFTKFSSSRDVSCLGGRRCGCHHLPALPLLSPQALEFRPVFRRRARLNFATRSFPSPPRDSRECFSLARNSRHGVNPRPEWPEIILIPAVASKDLGRRSIIAAGWTTLDCCASLARNSLDRSLLCRPLLRGHSYS